MADFSGMTLEQIKDTKEYYNIPYGYNKSKLRKAELVEVLNQLNPGPGNNGDIEKEIINILSNPEEITDEDVQLLVDNLDVAEPLIAKGDIGTRRVWEILSGSTIFMHEAGEKFLKKYKNLIDWNVAFYPLIVGDENYDTDIKTVAKFVSEFNFPTLHRDYEELLTVENFWGPLVESLSFITSKGEDFLNTVDGRVLYRYV